MQVFLNLQLCGQHVDLYLKSVGSPAMNDLFSSLKEIGERSEQHPSVHALIKSVIALRDRNWASASSNGAAHQYAENNPYARENDYDVTPDGNE